MITLDKVADSIEQTGRFWIVFTGDSITSCEWVHPNWREIVEYVLKEEITKVLKDWKTSSWGIRTFNFAYDGSTSHDLLKRVDAMKMVNPDLVINVGGANDRLFRIDPSRQRENILEIIEKLDTRVVWCTSIPSSEDKKNEEYEEYSLALLEIPKNKNLQIVDMFNIYKKFPLDKFFTFKSEENADEGIKKGDPDVFHPNQLGNAYIAKVVLEEVFGISFNPEKYWKDTLSGEKFPSY